MTRDKNRTVFSTEQTIPKPTPTPVTAEPDSVRPAAGSRQRVVIRLEKKGRGGKSVTLIEGLQLRPRDAEEMLKQMKSRLGTGGALKDGVLELQGDRRDAVVEFLEGIGYQPKRAGG
ncbi:MAG TPA: translation initiation factor [Dissulfurispiraceae bacterium]|nr:translation initiation factor [Dissulfurispiraceae bacterium]